MRTTAKWLLAVCMAMTASMFDGFTPLSSTGTGSKHPCAYRMGKSSFPGCGTAVTPCLPSRDARCCRFHPLRCAIESSSPKNR
eukprot:200928-Rhodomonas_salina.1